MFSIKKYNRIKDKEEVMKKNALLCLLGLLMVGFILMSQASIGLSEAAETLKIGSYVSLSGPGAPWGIAVVRCSEMRIEEYNAAGGLTIGGKKYKLELVAYDHKYTSAGGLEAINKLVFQDKVKFIATTFGTAPNLAGLSVTEPNKVLHCTLASGAGLLGPDKPYSFRLLMGAAEYMPALYRWLHKEYPKAKKVAVLNRDDAWGKDCNVYGRKGAEAQGFKVVYDGNFPLGSKDFSPILTRMIAEKPDIIETTGALLGEGVLLLKQARELGYTGPMVTNLATVPELVLKMAGAEASEEAISALTIITDEDDATVPKKVKELARRYREKYNEPLPGLGVNGYDSITVVVEAIKKANSLDTTKVKKAMEALKLDLLQGPAKFTGEKTYGIKHQIVLPIQISRCRGGKFTLVALEKP